MKRTWAMVGGALACWLWGSQAPAWAARLHVQFPPANYRTQSPTMMVIGSADGPVLVAGQRVPQSPQGHFATRIPLQLGANQVVVEAQGLRRVLQLNRLAAGAQLASGQMLIPSSLQPAGAIAQAAGSFLPVQVQGMPGLNISIQLGSQRVPLHPLGAWFEAPPSRNVLTGALNAPSASVVTYAGLLKLPDAMGNQPTATLEARSPQGQVAQLKLGPIQLWPKEEGRLGEVLVPQGVVRSGPSTDHSRRYPLPQGAWVQVQALHGPWAKLEGGNWLPSKDLRLWPLSHLPPAVLRAVALKPIHQAWREFRITLTHPVAPSISSHPRGLSLHLNGVQPELDIIKATPDRVVRGITWEAEGALGVRFDLDLGREGGHGHRLRMEPGAVVLELKAPPVLHGKGGPLGGARILLDAGHGGAEDPGCADPLGHREADRSLPVGLELARLLREKGAEVQLTRETNRYLGLVERTSAIESWAPDLALSLHWNALPDDGDPANTRGIGSFWYHPQSQALAQDLHAWLTTRHARPSYGVFWDNLALTRPSVCPSVLLELGFLTNPEEAEWAADAQAMKALAQAIALGLEAHLKAQAQAAI